MKKKVLIYLSALKGGGAERTIVNIINNLDKTKFEVVLILLSSINNDYINLVSKEVKIRYLECERIRYGLFKLRKIILEEKPDLLFSTLFNNNITLLTAKLLSLKKIPTIVREASNRTQSGKVSPFNKFLTFTFYNFIATRVIALSAGVKQDLVKNFLIKRQKVVLIYNPIEILDIKNKSKEKVEMKENKNDLKNIIAVGRLTEAKDFFTLLKAFQIVLDHENVNLYLIGKGPLEVELKKYSRKLGIESSVQFLGFKSNPYKYMKASELLVLSSKWEGFAHVIVEAMVVGTPVISTDCKSGPAEIIKDNKYGVLVPVGNYQLLAKKVIELLRNEKLRDFYTKQGYKRAKDFSAEKIVKEYEKVFLSVLS